MSGESLKVQVNNPWYEKILSHISMPEKQVKIHEEKKLKSNQQMKHVKITVYCPLVFIQPFFFPNVFPTKYGVELSMNEVTLDINPNSIICV